MYSVSVSSSERGQQRTSVSEAQIFRRIWYILEWRICKSAKSGKVVNKGSFCRPSGGAALIKRVRARYGYGVFEISFGPSTVLLRSNVCKSMMRNTLTSSRRWGWWVSVMIRRGYRAWKRKDAPRTRTAIPVHKSRCEIIFVHSTKTIIAITG